jgi:hypothetical protein
MSEFYKFAGEHPILTVILAILFVSLVAKLVPWSKNGDSEE